ncbi:MAG: SMC family ATPase [Methanomicrobiales archaeon]|nr:SMC family ATPase [Methanomicrobiales archaeon]
MHLVRLHLRNFKRYRDQEVFFRDGITGILGNNGAGKSTIVDAVLFALYGVENTGLDKKHIVRASAGPRDRAEVRLELSVRGEEYTVVRTLGPRTQHTAQLNHGPKLLAKGVTDVDEKIRSILQMGPRDFMHTIFSAQKDLAALLDATPGSRKAWFRKVLGVDALKDRGGETLHREMAEAERRATLLEGRLQGTDPEVLLRRQGEADAAIAALADRIRSREEEQTALDARRAALEADLRARQQRKEQDLLIRSRITAAEAEGGRIRQELGRVQEEMAAIGSKRREFQILSAREAEFPALRERHDASTGRARRFKELAAEEKLESSQQEKIGKELERLKIERDLRERDQALLGELAPVMARRTEMQAQLAALAGKEAKYHDLQVQITRVEGELAAEGKRGADLHGRIERMKAAGERLVAIAGPWTEPGGGTVDPDTLIASLEGRRRDLLGTAADLRADREGATRLKNERERQLADISFQGADGACPTCRQPLGDKYRDLVVELGREMEEIAQTVASTAAAQETAEQELAALDAVMGDARGLRDTCAPLGEAMAEWDAIQERSLRLLSGREYLEGQIAGLGYQPSAKQALEQEVHSLDDAWKQHLTATERVKTLPEVRTRLLDQERELEKIREHLAGIAAERTQLAFDPGEHLRLEKEIADADRAHREYLALKAGMDRIPVLQEKIASLSAEGGVVQENVHALQKELMVLAFLPEELNRVEAALKENQAELVRVARELEAARRDQEHQKADRERIAAEMARMEIDRADLDRLREEVALLGLTRDQLNGFSDHLLGVVRDQVQGEAGRVLSEITDGRYDTVLIDDGFDLLVHDLGGDYPVSRFSGGEQDDVAIALRIALSRYIAQMHELHDSTFLIFDEIFGSQDEERRGNIFRALRTLEPHFPQIFLISHVAEVQGEFGNTLLVEAVSATESAIRDMEAGEA